MQGQVTFWNPNAVAIAPLLLNNSLRKIIDRRTWYGCYTSGQLICPNAVNGGQATVTLGSPTVIGTNTAWTQALIGRQFRLGLNTPPYTITQVDALSTPQTLTLALPWGGPFPPNQTTMTAGYNVVQMYFNLGPNVKYIKQVVNFQMGFKLWLNLTQDYLDNRDPWRIYQNFPWGIAPLPPDPNGNYVVELWPTAITQQVLPFNVYTQPANLVNDSDSLPPYIRVDVVCKDAISKALMYRAKDNPIVSNNPQIAAEMSRRFAAEFEADYLEMANADENLYRISATIQGEDLPFYTPGGALWDAQHAVTNASAGYDEGW